MDKTSCFTFVIIVCMTDDLPHPKDLVLPNLHEQIINLRVWHEFLVLRDYVLVTLLLPLTI